MIKLQDSALIDYFNSLEKGTILSNADVTKHMSLFNINFDGVTGEEDLQSFKVTKKGEIVNKVGIMGSPVELKPVFAQKMSKASRSIAHWEYNEALEQQTMNRVKNKMMIGAIRANGGSSIAETNFWDSPVAIKKGDGVVRKKINDFTLDDLRGTDLFNEVHTETLLGRNTNLTYDATNRRHIVSNRLHIGTPQAPKMMTSITANIGEMQERIGAEENEILSKKIKNLLSNTPSMYIEGGKGVDELLRELSVQEISGMEHLTPKQVLSEYQEVAKVIRENTDLSAAEKQNIRSDVDKKLGVDAPEAEKKRYYDYLLKQKKDARVVEEVRNFQKNAMMYLVDNRDYLNPENRGATLEQMNDDIYKEEFARKKAQDRDDKYLERLRSATHTQDENGNWVQNRELPGKQSDKLAQAIAIDANPTESTEGVAKSILRTIEEGRSEYQKAVDGLEPAKQKLKVLTTEYNELFKNQKNKDVMSADSEAAMKNLIARYLNEDEVLSKEQVTVVSEYLQASNKIDELVEKANQRENLFLREDIKNAIDELKTQQAYLTHGLSREAVKENDRRLRELGGQISEQTGEIGRLERTIRSRGYSDAFSKTIYDKETNNVTQVGVTKEMYNRYLDNPGLADDLLSAEAEQQLLYKKRKSASNVSSWYNALEKGTIVKGEYSDGMGYKISHISDDNMVYMQRPTLKVSDLNYSLNLTNQDLVANIDSIEDDLMEMFNPSKKNVVDTNLMLSQFENVEDGHITLFAELPKVKPLETEFTADEAHYARQEIYRAVKAGGNVERTRLPAWAIERIEQTSLELHQERLNSKASLDAEKERIRDLTKEIAGKKKGSEEYKAAMITLQEQREALRISQLKHAELKDIHANVFAGIENSIIDQMAKEKFTKASFKNDRIEAELKEFGFTQSQGTRRISISRDKFTSILIGTDDRVSPFYSKLLNSHFSHLRGEKGDGTNAVVDAIMNVIDEHIVLGTDLDLTDEAMVRNYMNGLNSRALSGADLTDAQRAKMSAYAESLQDKGIYDRVFDRLFPENVKRGMETAHSDNPLENIVRAIYKNQSQTMPEADITGQSMYAYIHNQDNAINARLKQTYQKQVLSLSVDELSNILDEFKSVGNSTPLSLDATHRDSDKPIYNAASYDEYNLEPSSRAERASFADDMRMLSGADIDIRNLEKKALDGEWPKLIENNPQMATVEKMIKQAGRQLQRSKTPEDNARYSQQLGRLNLYALGVLNGQEEEFKQVLNISELSKIYPDESLVGAALRNPANLNERQIATMLTLADRTGQRIEVDLPIGDGNRAGGYLRFNDKNEIEVYSPSANQSWLLNDTGTSTTTTINAEDARAYGTANRLASADSYSKQQPILRESIANAAQLKRGGEATVLSNIDATFGSMVDFVQNGQTGISYDIETTTTGAKHISNVMQPIEIYAQQVQADPKTGQLLRDANGNFGVTQQVFEDVNNADGTINKKLTTVIAPREFHALIALDNPAKDLINKIASDENYFNVGVRAKENIHIVDYYDAIINKPDDMSASEFLRENFGYNKKKGAAKIVNEMARKTEEFRFLHNVAKYAFGAEKSVDDITMFGKYSNGDAVETSNQFANTLKSTDRETYNSFFNKDGQLRENMTIAFRQRSFQNQMEQTARLISDAQTAVLNLENPNFNYGEGVQRFSTAKALDEFINFQEASDASVIIGQNVEKADNKTLVQTARLLEQEAQAKRREDFGAKSYIGEQLQIIKDARQSILDETIQQYTEDYANKFVVNPMAANDPRPGSKIPVANVSDALSQMNRSNANLKFDSAFIKARDAEIEVLNRMFDKVKFSSGEFTAEEMDVAKRLNLFGGNEFVMQSNTTKIAGLEKRLAGAFETMGVIDQQTISRIAYPQLASQSNASLMDFFQKDASLAHDGKVDTQFVSENIERLSMQVADFYNGNVTAENEALARVLSSIDQNPNGEGGFMERNSFRGGEFVSFTTAPEEGVQKGVYQLQGISEDGKTATFNRMVQGANGLVVDTSVPAYKMEGLTNAELAHRFATNVRFLPEGTEVDALNAYNDDISRRHFDKILSSNFSYESHMNQIRELEIQSGTGNDIFKNNPLFRIEERMSGANLLEAGMENMMDVADNKGTVNLASNPLERARRIYNTSIMKKSDMLKEFGKNAEETMLDPIERSLLMNKSLIDDASKEKFYNKNLSKEQLLALQEMNDFNHTELGFRLADLMDNVTALENQGLMSVPEKANLLQQWNNELKAKTGKHVYDVRDAAKIPEFMMTVKGDVEGTFKQMPYSNASIQVSSPTEIANSLTEIAKNINKVTEYTPGSAGLRNDYALNDTLLPHLRGLGVVGENDFIGADGKPRFVGLGELSHTIYNNLQANPGLLENHTAVDYRSMAANISDEDLMSLKQKTDELLAPFFNRQTEVQKIQFEGLKESKELMRNAGLYIPGMKLIAENYSPDDMETLSKFSNQSYLANTSTSELVRMADDVAGRGDDSAKAQTKMIYSEIAKRAATPSAGGPMSIDPRDIIADGDSARLEAARAMNWVRPISGPDSLHIPVSDMTQRRMVGTSFAGSKLGDVPEYMLNSVSTYGMRDSQTFDYEQRMKYSPYMQQQAQLIDWRETGFDGHDHRTDTKFNTARGEEPDYAAMNREIIEADQARGGARRNPTQFNEQEIGGNVSRDGYIREMVEQSRARDEASFPVNNESVSGKTMFNAQQPVSADDLRIRESVSPEMVEPTGERSSGLERYIDKTKSSVKENMKNFLAGENGGKWVAGLGVAAAALFTYNAMSSPLKLENRPEGHGVKGVTGTPEDDKQREPIQAPKIQTGGTSYVTSGDKGYTIKASGRAPSNIDSSQLQSTINNSMSGTDSVNINLRDDRTTLDNSWLEKQFSNFIERGHVGGE